LAEPSLPRVDDYGEEDREFNRYTLLGEYDALFLALLRQRCATEGVSDTALADMFRAHMNRGVTILQQRAKSLSELVALLPTGEVGQEY
jgi:DNA sulfur modification protein DndE